MRNLLFCFFICLVAISCSKKNRQSTKKVKIDGSSTVFPNTEAMAEEYSKVNKYTRVTVGVSGTGGGFKKFLANEIDINDASRNIKISEIKKAKELGMEYMEIPVAYDGISIVVNSKSFVDKLSVEQLKILWQDNSIETWDQLNPAWPKTKVKLYGPGHGSGTFDYFKNAIVGKKASFRSNYTQSEDDNMLVKGVSGDVGSLGFFGFAYYKTNKSKIKAVAIIGKKTGKAVVPSPKTIQLGVYEPLSRPIFVYVSKKSSQKKQVSDFVEYYIEKAMDTSNGIIEQVGYVPLKKSEYLSYLAEYKKFKSNP